MTIIQGSIMNKIKMKRLNNLFKKIIINDANKAERGELKELYQEYIMGVRSFVVHSS